MCATFYHHFSLVDSSSDTWSQCLIFQNQTLTLVALRAAEDLVPSLNLQKRKTLYFPTSVGWVNIMSANLHPTLNMTTPPFLRASTSSVNTGVSISCWFHFPPLFSSLYLSSSKRQHSFCKQSWMLLVPSAYILSKLVLFFCFLLRCILF